MPVKKTILIIKDEPHIVLGLKGALEFEGSRVASAGKRAPGRRHGVHHVPGVFVPAGRPGRSEEPVPVGFG
jgi:hypothetical protein